jgi:ESS family glutamate:Na+ symporter
MLTLDSIQTLACGGLCLMAGYGIRRHVPLLARFNIPAPVIGGLLVALIVLACRWWDYTPVQFDTELKQPLMIAFFTSIGFNASVALLKVGGRQVVWLLGLATVALVVQNLVGMGLATAFGLHPLFGVLAGSTTLAGGPATGLAFAPLFEEAGVHGAESIALATAMAGIVCGSILGAPLATMLMERFNLHPRRAASAADVAVEVVQDEEGGSADGEGDRIHMGLKGFVLIVVAMGIGSWVSVGLDALGVTLPSYIGAMLVGALIRNLDDATGWVRLPLVSMDVIGGICLSLFLAVALMDLHLWELAGLAMPLVVNLVVQAAIVALFCLWPLLWMMGRDYDAAVMAGGFTGFMLGTTANAMAVMGSMTERYGPAPRAFLVAPLVGAFFIDFTNAIIITIFINGWT